MTLDVTVLQKVAEWRLAGKERQTLNVPDAEAGWAVRLEGDRSDDLGCRLWSLTVQRVSAPVNPACPTLRDWAHRAAERVTGLLEDLQLHEVDVARNEALLRSEQPTQRGGELFYYEVLLKGVQEASLRRYKAVPGTTGREQVSFTLTHEALAKLARDLVAD